MNFYGDIFGFHSRDSFCASTHLSWRLHGTKSNTLFGGDMWYPMAVVIMFGLASGTLLALGLVPVLYSLLFPERSKA